MSRVQAKKNLGQHFLKDKKIAEKIAGALTGNNYDSVLEIGPGAGMLTAFLLKRNFDDLRVIEIDNESVHYLRQNFPELKEIIRADFLRFDIDSLFHSNFAVIGNLPYNISSQILFRILRYRNKITEVCVMLQKEVAERICAPPGTKVYGILSVLLQAWYDTEYLFTVGEDAFVPPPRVRSGVIRLTRNSTTDLGCDEALFTRVVKAGFNQRRKTLRNSMKAAFRIKNENYEDLVLRPEQLSVERFISLTNWIEKNGILSE
jgi:16S rRNA (adenine1518-N6/adenine1519-N6)-dimethyltransferase